MRPSDMMKHVSDMIDRKLRGKIPQFVFANYVEANALDSNLSVITIYDSDFDYVPKLDGLTLVEGDLILVLRQPGVPMVIIGKVIGDTSINEGLGDP